MSRDGFRDWGYFDALIFGVIWGLLIHPFLGMILGFSLFPTRKNPGSASVASWVSIVVTVVVLVYKLSLLNSAVKLDEMDPAPPGPIRELKASASPTSIEVSWLASGDDGDSGASGTFLGYALKPGSPRAFSALAAAESGTPQKYNLSLTPSGKVRTYTFELWAEDDMKKKSPHSKVEVEVPASTRVISFEDDPQATNWAAEGHWKMTDRIDFSCPEVGKWWSNFFPEANYHESLLGPKLTIPAQGSPELLFLAYCDLSSRTVNQVFLEITTNGKDWKKLKTYEGNKGYLGQQQVSLEAWKGREVQFRFRLKSSEGGGRGFSFSNVLVLESEKSPERPEDNLTDSSVAPQNEKNTGISENIAKPPQ